jgi:hypothetical protein
VSQQEGYTYRAKAIVDLSKVLTTLVATDIIKAINVPVGCVVKGVWVRVVTPCSAAMTVSGGDTASGVGWFAATALNAAAGTVIPPTGANLGAGAGKVYTTADSVNLVVAGATISNTGIFEIYARFERL